MTHREQLEFLREDMDSINKEMLSLFSKRMEISDKIANIKRDGNMSLLDENRENQILTRAADQMGEDLKSDTAIFMSTLMALSKRRQQKVLMKSTDVMLPPSRAKVKENISVGYQGVLGAWGEMAANTLYPESVTQNYEFFEDVFEAVKSEGISYGVLPIENSQTGAIGEVYDLLRRHGCYIVGQAWVNIHHCLMAKPGTNLDDVREVLSHPEGFRQCHNYLKNRSWDKITCRNTAVAAEMVAIRQDNRAAAIGSRRAAERNGLIILTPEIMDSALNKTRFISISSEPEYNEICDTISVTFSTAHKSGALCNVLGIFMTAGINLSRIESRPATGGKYRFFVDLQANILDSFTQTALEQAGAMCEYFEVLGCYNG